MFCKDCDELVSEVMSKRDMKPETRDVQCGFDSGQGVLKLAITLTTKDDLVKHGRAKYSEVCT